MIPAAGRARNRHLCAVTWSAAAPAGAFVLSRDDVVAPSNAGDGRSLGRCCTHAAPGAGGPVFGIGAYSVRRLCADRRVTPGPRLPDSAANLLPAYHVGRRSVLGAAS